MSDDLPKIKYWREGTVVPFPVDRVRPPLGKTWVEAILRAERRPDDLQSSRRRNTPD